MVHTNVARMRVASTAKVLTAVSAWMDITVMENSVMIMMSAKQLFTIAIRKPSVLILGARITVLVQKATKEMVETAKVSKNIQF